MEIDALSLRCAAGDGGDEERELATLAKKCGRRVNLLESDLRKGVVYKAVALKSSPEPWKAYVFF